MVQVQLHVERIANLVVCVAQTAGVEDDLGVIILSQRDAADVRDERRDLVRGGMIREATPNQVLHVLRQPGEHAGAAEQFRTFDRPGGKDDPSGREEPGLGGPSIAGDER